MFYSGLFALWLNYGGLSVAKLPLYEINAPSSTIYHCVVVEQSIILLLYDTINLFAISDPCCIYISLLLFVCPASLYTRRYLWVQLLHSPPFLLPVVESTAAPTCYNNLVSFTCALSEAFITIPSIVIYWYTYIY